MAMILAFGVSFSGGSVRAGTALMSENSRSENTKSENTRSENTRSENTRSENTRSENMKPEISVKADSENLYFEPLEAEIEVRGNGVEDTLAEVKVESSGTVISRDSGRLPRKIRFKIYRSGDYRITAELENGEGAEKSFRVENVLERHTGRIVRKGSSYYEPVVIRKGRSAEKAPEENAGAGYDIRGEKKEREDDVIRTLRIKGRYGETMESGKGEFIEDKEKRSSEDALIYEIDEGGEEAVKAFYEKNKKAEEEKKNRALREKNEAMKREAGKRYSAVAAAALTALILAALILDAKRRL